MPRPAGELPAPAFRDLTEDEIVGFRRDGVVVLRGVLQEEWVEALRLLMLDVFEHPTKWDMLYSRLNANFYGAQKSILLHHTSECGKELARAAPTTTISASLLGSSRLRVCEQVTHIYMYTFKCCC